MKTLALLALVATVVSCHLDKLLGGGGGAPAVSHGTPARLVFAGAPHGARAGRPIGPVRVNVADSAGVPVAGVESATVTIALGPNAPGGATLSGTRSTHPARGTATFADLRLDKASAGYSLTATTDGLGTVTSDTFSVAPDTPTRLVFSVPPSDAVQGAVITPPVEVTAYDSLDNKATNYSGQIRVALGRDGSVLNNAALSGATPTAAVAGVAKFANLRINQVGVGYTLTAAFGGATPVDTSTAFNVTPPPPGTGNLTVTNTTTGGTLDPDGYTVVVDGGPSQAMPTNGGTTFNTLLAGSHSVELDGVAGNCTVSGQNPRSVSVPVNATAQLAFAISCVTPPPTSGDLTVTTRTTGTNLPSGYAVSVDGGPNQGIGINSSVAFTGLNAGGHSVALVGIAGNCTVSGVNPRTVNVSAGTTTQTDFAINCVPPPSGGATHVGFTHAVQTTQAGQVIPIFRVSGLDANDNIVQSFLGVVTVSIAVNPGNGTLSGTATVPIVQGMRGVGEWMDISIDKPGNGYVLLATCPGLGSGLSDPFDITVGPAPSPNGATGLAFIQEPSTTRAGNAIPTVTVRVTDDNGHVVTGFTGGIWITISTNPGNATLSGTRRAVPVNGMATFSDLRIDQPGRGYILNATAWPLNHVYSTPFDVTP